LKCTRHVDSFLEPYHLFDYNLDVKGCGRMSPCAQASRPRSERYSVKHAIYMLQITSVSAYAKIVTIVCVCTLRLNTALIADRGASCSNVDQLES
jgi:hypothetical protein